MGRELLKKIVFSLTLVLLCATILMSESAPISIKGEHDSLKPRIAVTVPDDYPTIQSAINAASEGDTIFVRNGTYYENIVINKTLFLVGESRETTIIDGEKQGTVANITANNVVLRRFTIKNSGFAYPNASICLLRVNFTTVAENIIELSNYGALLLSSNNVSIAANQIADNSGHGIVLSNSCDNIIKDNYLVRNRAEAINLFQSCRNHISRNSFLGNDAAVWMDQSSNNVFLDNNFQNCTASFLPVVAWANSKENWFAGNYIDNFDRTCTGLALYSCNESSIVGNDIDNCAYGVYLSSSNRNRIYHNNVVNNTHQAYVFETSLDNSWEGGYPAGGNFWSDYTGADLFKGPDQNDTGSDGIGDTPYSVDSYNIDHYPLMQPIVPFENQTIFIRADGNVDPLDAPILRQRDTYTLISDITSNDNGIIVEREGIIVDGAGHAVRGTGAAKALDSRGIDLTERRNVTIKNISIQVFAYGIWLVNCSGSNIMGNGITGSDVGVYLNYSANNSLTANNITNNGYSGIELDYSSNNNVTENSITNNDKGVWFYSSSNNSATGNILTANNYEGIFLYGSSNHNNVTANEIADNHYGIRLDYSSNNNIAENTIAHNGYGIEVFYSSDNTISHNNFNNTVQLNNITPEYANSWNNGCEGNHWSNYNGTDTDNDGVGDTFVPWEGVDNYPLMNVHWNPCDINHDLKVDMKDIGTSAKAFSTTPVDTLWNPHADITGPEPLVPDRKVDMRDISLVARHFGKSAR